MQTSGGTHPIVESIMGGALQIDPMFGLTLLHMSVQVTHTTHVEKLVGK